MVKLFESCVDKKSWKEEEDKILFLKHKEIGDHWMRISFFFPGRTNYSARNRFLELTRKNEKKK